jgi:flagellar biosynthesis regulator FlaF
VLDKKEQKIQVTPRTLKIKKLSIEKWVEKEKEDIKKYKKDIVKGLITTADTIRRVSWF